MRTLCDRLDEIYKRNLHCVNHIPGIHDNGPRDHELWRRTLTMYSNIPYMRENSAPVVNSAPDNNWLNKIGFFLLLQ